MKFRIIFLAMGVCVQACAMLAADDAVDKAGLLGLAVIIVAMLSAIFMYGAAILPPKGFYDDNTEVTDGNSDSGREGEEEVRARASSNGG